MTALDRSTAPVVRAVGLAFLALLLATHELLVRQLRAFLVPTGEYSVALACAALGASCGLWLALAARRPRRLLPLVLVALAAHCSLSITLFHAAFRVPELWGPARLVVPGLSGALLCASWVCLVRSFATAFTELHVTARLLSPAALLFGLFGVTLASSLAAELGVLASGLAVGVLLSLLALRLEWALGFVWGAAPRGLQLRAACAVGSALLSLSLLARATTGTSRAEHRSLPGSLVFAEGAGRDRLLVTSGQGAFTVFVGGALRWSGLDGTRYADALVEPALASSPRADRCLVLGGSDGLVVRKLLDAPGVREVTFVTPEAPLVRSSSRLRPLAPLTRGALSDPRLLLVEDEPLPWLDARGSSAPRYDVVVVDLPDPTDPVNAKNFTQYFYERVRAALAEDGVVTLQAAPLLRARRVYENVAGTMASAGFALAPYEAELPALGLWGFLLAAPANGTATEGGGAPRRAPWPALDKRLPLKPLSLDTAMTPRGPPTRLYDLRVVHLLEEARELERSAADAP